MIDTINAGVIFIGSCIIYKSFTNFVCYSFKARFILRSLVLFLTMTSILFFIIEFTNAKTLSAEIAWYTLIVYGLYDSYQNIFLSIDSWPDDVSFWKQLFGLYNLLKAKEYRYVDLIVLRGFV